MSQTAVEAGRTGGRIAAVGPLDIRLRAPASEADRATVVTLFREYQQDLGVDLCFQNFEAELADLDRQYGPPHGGILLAEAAKPGPDPVALTAEGRVAASWAAAGCVAVRPMQPGYAGGPDCCEMKRMFIRPAFRGLGLGRQLAVASMDLAVRAGYRRMRLDTLLRLEPAVDLYRSLGFAEIAAYYDNPLEDVVYMEAALSVPETG